MEPMESDVLPPRRDGPDSRAARTEDRRGHHHGHPPGLRLRGGHLPDGRRPPPVLLAEALGLLAVVLALQFCISFPGLLLRLAPVWGRDWAAVPGACCSCRRC
ncbi:hypothetical protein LT493_11950 [Streptomyces tricolor]|nr:hypothetical protein [Streptomyces tricolor]